MMEAARISKVKKFVYASSSSVYGDEPNLPKQEGREGNLLSPYALTKRADEEFARMYTKFYGLETYGMRYFNVFGCRQDPDGAYAAVIPKFLKLLLQGETPTINGDGRQSRDFTYIDGSHPGRGEFFHIGAIRIHGIKASVVISIGKIDYPVRFAEKTFVIQVSCGISGNIAVIHPDPLLSD